MVDIHRKDKIFCLQVAIQSKLNTYWPEDTQALIFWYIDMMPDQVSSCCNIEHKCVEWTEQPTVERLNSGARKNADRSQWALGSSDCRDQAPMTWAVNLWIYEYQLFVSLTPVILSSLFTVTGFYLWKLCFPTTYFRSQKFAVWQVQLRLTHIVDKYNSRSCQSQRHPKQIHLPFP